MARKKAKDLKVPEQVGKDRNGAIGGKFYEKTKRMERYANRSHCDIVRHNRVP